MTSATDQARAAAAVAGSRRVLIVDDDEDFADSLAELLALYGYSTRSAGNPDQAVRVADAFRPDVAVIDIRLGRANGIELIFELRHRCPDLACVLMTAYPETDTAIDALRRGAFDYLRKPLNHNEVVAVLESCFLRQRVERDNREFQQNLIEAEERARLLLDSAGVAIYATDIEGSCMYCNSACLELLGYDMALDLLGKNVHDLVHAAEPGGAPAGQDDCPLCRVQTHGESVEADGISVRRADGSIVTADYRSYPLRREGAVVGVVASLIGWAEPGSARPRPPLQTRTLGEVAGGVAHSFNNLLAVVLGNLELLDEKWLGEGVQKDLLVRAQSAALEGANLTRQLVAYAGKLPLRPQRTNCNDIVSRMVVRLQQVVDDTIVVRTIAATNLPEVATDPDQLESALLNLAFNARDAMPAGGTLTIETATVDVGANDQAGVPAGRYAALTVADSGTGMTQEVLERACDPFYTTKEVDQGLGLGLSAAHGFVTQSGGHLWIASEVGRGTKVTIYLPALEAAAAKAR